MILTVSPGAFIVMAYIITTIFDFFLKKQVPDSGPSDDNAAEFLRTLAPSVPSRLIGAARLVRRHCNDHH
jgi:hypothetical protein